MEISGCVCLNKFIEISFDGKTWGESKDKFHGANRVRTPFLCADRIGNTLLNNCCMIHYVTTTQLEQSLLLTCAYVM